MDQLLKRLLIIAVLVSLIFSSSAQNAASTEENTSPDAQYESDCDPRTEVCRVLKEDRKLTKEAVTEEDTTEYKQSTGTARGACHPGTTLCIPPEPRDPVPTKKAVPDEDASDAEPSNICDSFTGLCQGQHISNYDTVTSPVESSEKENETKSGTRTICNPITKKCTGPQTNSIIPEPTEGHLPKQDSFKPNPTNTIVCAPGTPNCGQPKPKDEL